MNDDIKKMTQDVQDRIRELAYAMWESAGRQQGMATEYWLAAEREVLKTMQRAAEAIMPSSSRGGAKPAPKPEPKAEAKPAPKPEAKPAPKLEAKPEAKAEAKPAPKAEAKPTPKAETKPADQPAAQPAAAAAPSIEDIEGIGPAFAKKLKAAGIATPADLLDKCGGAKGRKAVADHTGIPLKRVMRWVNMADLMRLDRVDGNAAELLEAAGVDTVKELAGRRADALAKALAEVNAAKSLAPTTPDEKTVAGWIAQAKTVEPKVSP